MNTNVFVINAQGGGERNNYTELQYIKSQLNKSWYKISVLKIHKGYQDEVVGEGNQESGGNNGNYDCKYFGGKQSKKKKVSFS